jgi:hypothetical protein
VSIIVIQKGLYFHSNMSYVPGRCHMSCVMCMYYVMLVCTIVYVCIMLCIVLCYVLVLCYAVQLCLYADWSFNAFILFYDIYIHTCTPLRLREGHRAGGNSPYSHDHQVGFYHIILLYYCLLIILSYSIPVFLSYYPTLLLSFYHIILLYICLLI